MSKINDGHARGKYTLEFKLEAVRLVAGGHAVPVTAKILGVGDQTMADAMLDRLMQNHHRFTLTGESLHKKSPRAKGNTDN